GLFIFLICYFIFPLWIFRKERRIFAILIFLLLAICLFTENMFSRYQGIVLISFILPLASKIKNVSLSKPPLELVD
ncbi:MAG TPA: hypothetical protein VLB84_10150, partial [Bacteroidia bacterium]|nr:hypothetical protein [Bacteroidia bacterium]